MQILPMNFTINKNLTHPKKVANFKNDTIISNDVVSFSGVGKIHRVLTICNPKHCFSDRAMDTYLWAVEELKNLKNLRYILNGVGGPNNIYINPDLNPKILLHYPMDVFHKEQSPIEDSIREFLRGDYVCNLSVVGSNKKIKVTVPFNDLPDEFNRYKYDNSPSPLNSYLFHVGMSKYLDTHPEKITKIVDSVGDDINVANVDRHLKKFIENQAKLQN